ncbi:MAG: glycosyltransferase family 2 protein [Planctomycetaceae bacterium]
MVDVILPALDEAEALAWLLPRLPGGYRAIVVDNGSSDGTAVVARELGAAVVEEPERGFGAACWAGLRAAREDVVCFMDADASLDPRDLASVAAPVLRGELDLVLGARDATRGAWPLHARLGNRVIAAEVRRRTGLGVRDLGPMRSARRERLLGLGLRDRRFGWPFEMVLRAHACGWRIGEVEVPYHPRVGRSKVTGTVRGTARTIVDLARVMRCA